MESEKKRRYLQITVYVILAILVVAYVITLVAQGKVQTFFGTLTEAFKPIFYAVLFAFVAWQIITKFENGVFAGLEKKKSRKKLVRGLSVLCTYLLILLVIGFVVGTIIPQLIQSVSTFASRLSDYATSIQEWFNHGVLGEEELSFLPDFLKSLLAEQKGALREYTSNLIPWLTSNLSDILSKVLTQAGSYAGFFASFARELQSLILGLIFSVYFTLYKERVMAQIAKVFRSLFSEKAYQVARKYVQEANGIFGGFLVGKILDSMIIGVLCLILMSIFGMPYAPLISMIVGVSNIIPFFGPFIGAIPSARIVLIASPGHFIGFIIMILLLQQFDGNVLGPKILGDSINLSPLWIIISITVMSGLFGIFGMFFGVPTFAVFYSIVKDIVENRLKKKGMDTETEEYFADPVYVPLTKGREKRPGLISRFFAFLKKHLSAFFGKLFRRRKKEPDSPEQTEEQPNRISEEEPEEVQKPEESPQPENKE